MAVRLTPHQTWLSCLLPEEPTYTVGLMFWLSRNRFVGSYLFFRATSRS